ncbi:MAG: glycerol kinase GlpK [Chloroflexi bacterium]|nr:glycerol kinase GlpK [Chloroflexota bacterium]
MSTDRTLLALDQSTSATKAILFDVRGHVLDQESAAHAQHYPLAGWVEHDAEEIYQNTLTVLRHVLARCSADSLPAFLSITNQRETVVIFDRSTGQPLRPAIVWQCRRGEPICQRLVDAGHEPLVHERTGLKIDTYFPASKITWLIENEPAVRSALQEGRALIGTIDAYLIYRLTGGAVFATDATNASRTLLYDIHTLGWNDELCALFGVPRNARPEVRDSNAGYGATTLEGTLDQPLPICGVMGDSQAALFAQHCFTPGSAKVTFGTGSSILVNIGDRPIPAEQGIVTALAWQIDGAATFAYEGLINYSGATIAWLTDQLRLIESPRETEALARSVPDNGGVYLVPAFVGLSAPYWQPNARAAIVGLSPASTREHVVRAALESIAYQIRDIIELMGRAAGLRLQKIHGDGGGVANLFLMQLVADVCRLEVEASEVSNLSAWGAALTGLLGRGVYDGLGALNALPLPATHYVPQAPEAIIEAWYQGWLAAVQRVL